MTGQPSITWKESLDSLKLSSSKKLKWKLKPSYLDGLLKKLIGFKKEKNLSPPKKVRKRVKPINNIGESIIVYEEKHTQNRIP